MTRRLTPDDRERVDRELDEIASIGKTPRIAPPKKDELVARLGSQRAWTDIVLPCLTDGGL